MVRLYVCRKTWKRKMLSDEVLLQGKVKGSEERYLFTVQKALDILGSGSQKWAHWSQNSARPGNPNTSPSSSSLTFLRPFLSPLSIPDRQTVATDLNSLEQSISYLLSFSNFLGNDLDEIHHHDLAWLWPFMTLNQPFFAIQNTKWWFARKKRPEWTLCVTHWVLSARP